MEKKLNVLPAVDVVRPSFNEWMKEFKVSSKYKTKEEPPHRHVFDTKIFKNNLKTKKWDV